MAGIGFIPIGGMDGRPYNGATLRCVVLGADTTDINIGDMVKIAGSGDAAGVPDVTLSAAGEVILGAVVSIEPRHAADERWIDGSAETADRYVNVAVATDPMLFRCRPSEAVAKTSVGLMADVVVGASAAPFYQSTSTFNAGATATTGKGLQLVGFIQDGVDITSTSKDIIVRVVEPQMGSALASIGV